MFIPIRFKTSVQLSPRELDEDLDAILYKKLQKTLEGVCSRYGYIKPKSIEMLRRSAGMFLKQHFNGYIRYDIVCKAEVCNPAIGMVVQATVKNKNALGVLAESSIPIEKEDVPVLDIIIPRKAAGVSSEINLDNIQINDVIYVSVLGKRYQLNDTKISIIGKAVKEPNTESNASIDIDEVDEQAREKDEDDDDIEQEDEEEEDTDTTGGQQAPVGGEYDLYIDGGLMNDDFDDASEGGGEDGEDDSDGGNDGGYYGGDDYD